MKKKDLVDLEEKYKKNIALVRQTLSEHLSAINENTSELQSFFDYLQEIEQKIDKLSQRIDNVQLQSQFSKEKPFVEPLNPTEKKIFLVLYTEEKPLDCMELSQRSEVPISIIREHLASIAQKGIPLNRSFVENRTFYKIEKTFKEWQAKENIVNVSLNSFLESKQNIQTKLKTYNTETFE